ncbi:MAG: glucose 1-dehydrogenase [Lentisphaeria bacterium]|jgi:NAD(P)-dependent dehydrogenase (short-subunit alcohol dehydrogenase family)|nr:glucose 1-dehydrogenase [Lentisphaeria bacterium]MDP7741971.1 glucose 1-dehydrogenase [Lentisphaeria bacterium]
MLLKDRVAIVTGGSSGIGRGIALELAREGARVVVADIREDPRRGIHHETDVSTTTLEEIEKLGSAGRFIHTDVTDVDHLQRLVDETVEWQGRLDILVNNAGSNYPGDSQSISIDEWDQVIGLNLRSVFAATKLAVPHLKKSACGRIIQISSVNAFGGGGGPPYASAKAAVVNMVRDLAIELGPDNITVNAICPGYIETALQDYATPELIEQCRDATPLPRLGTPKDVGRLAVFLASDNASWLTGDAVVLDGGMTCRVCV